MPLTACGGCKKQVSPYLLAPVRGPLLADQGSLPVMEESQGEVSVFGPSFGLPSLIRLGALAFPKHPMIVTTGAPLVETEGDLQRPP